MRTVAGLAANSRSWPVNGSMPRRFFLAGTSITPIFSRPGSVNSRAPFLCTEARMVSSSAAITALTALVSTPVCSARCWASPALVKVSFTGFSAGAAAAFVDLAAGLAAAVFFAGVAAARAGFLAVAMMFQSRVLVAFKRGSCPGVHLLENTARGCIFHGVRRQGRRFNLSNRQIVLATCTTVSLAVDRIFYGLLRPDPQKNTGNHGQSCAAPWQALRRPYQIQCF